MKGTFERTAAGLRQLDQRPVDGGPAEPAAGDLPAEMVDQLVRVEFHADRVRRVGGEIQVIELGGADKQAELAPVLREPKGSPPPRGERSRMRWRWPSRPRRWSSR
mgnify:CR=1 FL=1